MNYPLASFSEERALISKSSFIFAGLPPSGHLIQGRWWQLCHKTFNLFDDSEGHPFIKINEFPALLTHTYINKVAGTPVVRASESDGPRDTAKGQDDAANGDRNRWELPVGPQ